MPLPGADVSSRRWYGSLLLAAGVIAGLSMLPVAHDLAHLPPITGRRWASAAQRASVGRRAVRDLAIWWGLFLVVAAVLTRAPRRAAVACALALGVAVPVAALAHRAPLSNDLYRYSWDARVQAHGVDPYRYAPADPALQRLRTRWLWPDAAGCRELNRPPGCWRINRVVQRTIYPPVAEGWFTVVGAVLPNRAEDLGWELAGLAVSLAVSLALLVGLRRAGNDSRWVVWWCCCPLVPVEAVQNAHVDTVAALAIVVAVVLARARRVLWASAAAAAGVLVKLYPLLLLPALVRRRPVLGGAVAGSLVGLAYLPHVVAVGPHVLGYLPGYLREEGYTSGTRFLLLDRLGIPPVAAAGVAAAVLVAVGMLAWRRDADVAQSAGTVLAAAFVLTTPVQPWYGLTLVALAVLAGRPVWIAVAAAGYPVYLSIFIGAHASSWGSASFGVAAAACTVAALLRARPGAMSLRGASVTRGGAGFSTPQCDEPAVGVRPGVTDFDPADGGCELAGRVDTNTHPGDR